MLALALAAGALAGDRHRPVKVRIDGEDVDGRPSGLIRPPGHVGATVWVTGLASRIRGLAPGGVSTTADTDSVTGLNVTAFTRVGKYRAQLDVFTVNQTSGQSIFFGGQTFMPGAAIKQNDVVVRGAREIGRVDTAWGGYAADVGLRVTS
ncbi:MAG: hypothetical protein HY815_21060, partial [Candidatus Riflebacteria bacterium]|nr:hypothetical protein [Candidatus Riflebacteria bacterium]